MAFIIHPIIPMSCIVYIFKNTLDEVIYVLVNL